MGTTHADYFHGRVPVTEPLSTSEVESEYELNRGRAIARRFQSIEPASIPAVLVSGHGPFCWGRTPAEAAHAAVILEEIARMAFLTLAIDSGAERLEPVLHARHFLRKHGANAYYGQR